MTAWALFCHDFDLSKGINILSEKCPVVLDHYKDTLNIEGKPVRLDAGMNATAEIKTGKRSVISYLLSPLQTKVDESLRER